MPRCVFCRLSNHIKELIAKNSSTEEIEEVAIREGMKSLRQSGIEKIFSGITTIEEVVRYTVEAI